MYQGSEGRIKGVKDVSREQDVLRNELTNRMTE